MIRIRMHGSDGRAYVLAQFGQMFGIYREQDVIFSSAIDERYYTSWNVVDREAICEWLVSDGYQIFWQAVT